MTENLFTGTLNKNQNKDRIHNLEQYIATVSIRARLLTIYRLHCGFCKRQHNETREHNVINSNVYNISIRHCYGALRLSRQTRKDDFALKYVVLAAIFEVSVSRVIPIAIDKIRWQTADLPGFE